MADRQAMPLSLIHAIAAEALLSGPDCSTLARRALRGGEQRLDPRRFVRIHRPRIVRIDGVRTLTPLFHGGYRLTLRDGTHLTSGRGYREQLRAALGLPVGG